MADEREITPPPLIYSLFILRRLLWECDVNVHTVCLNRQPQVSHFNREVQASLKRGGHPDASINVKQECSHKTVLPHVRFA